MKQKLLLLLLILISGFTLYAQQNEYFESEFLSKRGLHSKAVCGGMRPCAAHAGVPLPSHKAIKETPAGQKNVNIQNLPTDVYVIQAFDGKQWTSSKIIKQ